MTYFFYIGIFLFIALFLTKATLAVVYWRRYQSKSSAASQEDWESEVSIVQPILSGDSTLEQNLIENLENSKTAQFIWLIDSDDPEAHKIMARIIEAHSRDVERIKIIEIGAIPEKLNPKVYKLKQALPVTRKYVVILDDDTVIDARNLALAIAALESQKSLVTGVPFYQSRNCFGANLVTAFVNGNSLFTYLPMALLEQPKTINGMFYLAKREDLIALNSFAVIEDKLCDDFEIAKLFRNNGARIIQAPIPCRVITTIDGWGHYIKLMKRWMLFADNFVRESLTFKSFFIILLPSCLPLVFLVFSTFLGLQALGIFLILHLLKALVSRLVRVLLLENKEPTASLIYEMIADYLQPIHYIHAKAFNRKIQWRNRTVNLKNNQMRFTK